MKSIYSPRVVTKNILYRRRSLQVLPDNPEYLMIQHQSNPVDAGLKEFYFMCLLSQNNNEAFNILTPWSRVLLEKLTGSQLVKKFPVFYGIQRFIKAFTSARHLSLS